MLRRFVLYQSKRREFAIRRYPKHSQPNFFYNVYILQPLSTLILPQFHTKQSLFSTSKSPSKHTLESYPTPSVTYQTITFLPQAPTFHARYPTSCPLGVAGRDRPSSSCSAVSRRERPGSPRWQCACARPRANTSRNDHLLKKWVPGGPPE